MSKRTIQDYLSQLDNLGFQDPKSGINVERGDLQDWQALLNKARRMCVNASLAGMSLDAQKRAAELEGWHGIFDDEGDE